jgi:hypothetical protein
MCRNTTAPAFFQFEAVFLANREESPMGRCINRNISATGASAVEEENLLGYAQHFSPRKIGLQEAHFSTLCVAKDLQRCAAVDSRVHGLPEE